MPITGTLTADFTSFQAACSEAVTTLKGFESDSAKVTRQLQTMVDSLNGNKVASQAAVMAEAVDRIGGVSKLTEAELARLGPVASEAVEKLTLMGKDVPPGIQAIADKAREAADSHTTWTAKIAETAAGYVTGQAIWQAAKTVFAELVSLVGESVKAFADAEAVQTRLTSALKNTHQDVAETSTQFKAYAAQIQATTTLEDDAVLSVIALGTEMGVTRGQMGDAITVAADLSAAWGIGLQEAMDAIVKGGEGVVRTFKAHGIVLDEARAKTEGLSYVLPELEKHFSGNAAALLDTYSGKVKAMGVAWGNLEEAVGGAVAAIDSKTGALSTTTDAIRGLTEVVEKGGVSGFLALAATGSNALGTLIDIGKAANDAAANLKQTAVASTETRDRFKETGEWIASLRHNYEDLTLAQKTQINEAVALNASQAEIAAHLQVSELAVKHYVEAQKDAAQQAKLALEDEQKAQKEALDIEDLFRKVAGDHRKAEMDEHLKQLQQSNKLVIDALKERMTLEAKQAADSEINWATYYKDVASLSGNSYKSQLADIDAWVTKQIASHVLAKTDTADFYNWVAAESDVLKEKLVRGMLEADTSTRDHFESLANKAKAAYDFAIEHADRYTSTRIDQLQKESLAAQTALINWQAEADKQLAGTKNSADAATAALRGMSAALSGPVYQATSAPTGQSAPAFAGYAAPVQSYKGNAPVVLPSFQEGGVGDFGAGTTVNLHGVEAIVPLKGTALGGTSSGPSVTNHIYVNGTAADVARKIAAEIMRTVKQGGIVS